MSKMLLLIYISKDIGAWEMGSMGSNLDTNSVLLAFGLTLLRVLSRYRWTYYDILEKKLIKNYINCSWVFGR